MIMVRPEAITDNPRRNGRLDADVVKAAARGRGRDILVSAGMSADALDGRHGPCPRCGGKDRFRFDPEREFAICNACFDSHNGDIIAAVQWWQGIDFKAALRFVADCVGVNGHASKASGSRPSTSPQPSANGSPKKRSFDRSKFRSLQVQEDRHFELWAATKPPIRREPVVAAGAIAGNWCGRVRIGFPAYLPGETEPCGMVLYDRDGNPFPAVGRLSERKTHNLGSNGWVAVGGLSAIEAASAIWLVEGVPDMLAIAPHLPAGHVPATSICGAKARAGIPLPDLADKRIIVIGDADQPGQVGAERMAAAAARAGGDVRLVRLPYDVTPSGGKDVRDYLNDGGTVEQLLELAEAGDPVDPGAAGPGSSAGDRLKASELDPMQTARTFLEETSRSDERSLRYWRDEFWRWDGTRYVPLADNFISGEVIRFIDQFAEKITRGAVGNILACTKAECQLLPHIEQPAWLDGRADGRNHIAMQNGILDVENCDAVRLLPHSPQWFSRVCLPYAFDPEADCPTWKAVLGRSLEGDAERIALLQEWFGYCLVFETALQKFLMMSGNGSNGKSVVCAAIIGILGKDNVSCVPLEAFGGRFQLNSTIGRLVNVAAEVGDLDKMAEGFLKAFTSGDRMQFERKQRDPFEATPTARLVLATNTPPRFSDRSGGIWRRMLFLPFNVEIPDDEKIIGMDDPDWWQGRGELPGIFNWALQGLKRLRERKRFTKSSVCTDELEDYRRDNNPARTFLVENYREHPQGRVMTADVYGNYKRWCGENGHHAMSSRSFGREIVQAFRKATREQISQAGSRSWGYVGIAEGAQDDQF